MEGGISGHYSSLTAHRHTHPSVRRSYAWLDPLRTDQASLPFKTLSLRPSTSLPPSLRDISLSCSSLKIGPPPELGMMSRGQPAFKFHRCDTTHARTTLCSKCEERGRRGREKLLTCNLLCITMQAPNEMKLCTQFRESPRTVASRPLPVPTQSRVHIFFLADKLTLLLNCWFVRRRIHEIHSDLELHPIDGCFCCLWKF